VTGEAPGERAEGGAATSGSLDRIATVPNLLSAIRIALIPVFVGLLLHHGTELAGLLLFGVTVSTDWVDGYIARRTNQVSNLGKLLDPTADRLAIAAGLLAFVARDAVPLWAALLVLIRDAAVFVGGLLLLRAGVRIDVRWIGKGATMALMIGIPAIAWANFDIWPGTAFRVLGWTLYLAGIVAYYAAAGVYAADARRALKARSL
jgi:cardiolipin synthase (CMP-forming)